MKGTFAPLPTAQEEQFEQALQGYFTQAKAELDIPLDRLMSKAEEVYLPDVQVTPHEAASTPWWNALSHWWWSGAMGTLAAAACVLFVLRSGAPGGSPTPGQPPSGRGALLGTAADAGDNGYASPDWLSTRGADEQPLMQVVVKRKQHKARTLRSNTLVKRGDQLRLIVAWKRGSFVTLVYRDAKGHWSPLYPNSPSQPGIALKSKRRFPLPGSLEITDKPNGNEFIWACFAAKGIKAKKLIQSLRQKGPSPCAHLQQFVLARPKETRP